MVMYFQGQILCRPMLKLVNIWKEKQKTVSKPAVDNTKTTKYYTERNQYTCKKTAIYETETPFQEADKRMLFLNIYSPKT